MRRLRALAPILVLTSCAYFNGIYNAHEAARRAEKQMRAGREAEALGSYATAAVKAETVLARYPKSRWTTEALYVAGVGEAMSNQCQLAIPRLERFLERDASQQKREKATVALASCYVRNGKFSQSLGMLEPVLKSKDRVTAERATLWAARAAIGMGDNARANALLATVDIGATQWELAASSLQSGDAARAESLYALRAERGDFREEILPALRQLWDAGRRDKVLRIANNYESSRLRSASKARVYLTVAELLTDAGDDSVAVAFLLRTKRLATDTVLDREASARLTLLSLKRASTLLDARNAINASTTTARGTQLQRRMEENLLLLSLLEKKNEPSGSTLFLAGEIARDSLRAPLLATTYFLRAASPQMNALVAPKALLAAAALMPDSAESFHRQLRDRFPRSPYLVMLEGGDPGDAPQLVETDRMLRQWWDSAARYLSDTLRSLRPDTVRPVSSINMLPRAVASTSHSLVSLSLVQ